VNYPLTTHTIEHLVLGLIMPALFILTAVRKMKIHRLALPIRTPISWLVGVGMMLAPLEMHHPLLHTLENLSCLLAGAVFWWPILGPRYARLLSPLGTVAYLFSACLSCTLLGAYLTFTARSDPDRQLAGLLMWVPGCFVYLSAILLTVKRWYSESPA